MLLGRVCKKCFVWLFSLLVLAGVVGSTVAVLLLYWASRDLPSYSRIADYNPPRATTILARDGSVLGMLYHEKRFLISLDDMSRFMPLAFLAAEDDSFYSHLGIDPLAILRSFILNVQQGRMTKGGSTITQQLVKQLLLTSERSLTRKMKEAILAFHLEKMLSKDEILTIYLNHIYLGEHSYGVEAAARTYFGKHASDLTLAECAILAGLPKAPSDYNPFRHPEMAKNRQKYVLGRLRDLKWIETADYEKAMAEPLVYWSMPEGQNGAARWYFEEARRLLIEFFTESNLKALGIETSKSGEDYVYEAGLTVQTSMVPFHQEAAGKALRRGLEELDKRQGWRGPISRLDRGAAKAFLDKSTFSPEDLAANAWVQAVVTLVEPGRAGVQLGNGYSGLISMNNMNWARRLKAPRPGTARDARQILTPGDLVWVSAAPVSVVVPARQKGGKQGTEQQSFDPSAVTKDKPISLVLQQEPEVQGALASLEARSGDVVALIGGYQFGNSHFNRATQARRQPGSTFKPVVYSAAMDLGFTASSSVLDGAFVYINPYTNAVWRPSSFDKFRGVMPLYQALAASRNTCAVRVAHAIGVPNIIQRAKALGLEPDFPNELSISLGAVAVSPLNMTQAYAAFANQGLGVRPRIITSIRDAAGRQIYRQDEEHWQAVSPQNAYIMATMLKNAVNAGTGSRAKVAGRNIAGKTGTTNDVKDVWFIGFTPQLVTGVYVGYDQVRSLGRAEQGGHTAAPIFRNYRTAVEPLYPVEDFAKPSGIILSNGMAYRSDMPMQGLSAVEGGGDAGQDGGEGDGGTSESEGGEELLRQMF